MNKILFFICLSLLIFCTGCDKSQKEEVKVGIVGNNSPIDRATVSRMLSLANFSKNEIEAMDKVIDFKDVSSKDWFEKYINCAYIKGDMSGIDNENFAPYNNLTITQTQYLIDKYDKSKKIKIDNQNKDKPISYALWCDIYYQLMKHKNVIEKNLVILADKNTNSQLKQDFAITDMGLFSFEGIDTSSYINKKIKTLVKDNNVIAVVEVLETEPTLKRCYISKTDNNYIEIFVGGAKRKFFINNKDIKPKQTGIIADIKIKDEEVLDLTYYNEPLRGKINKIDDKIIRLNNTNYVLDEDFVVYKTLDNGKIELAKTNDLIIGQDIANYFTKGNENKIYACIIDNNPNYDNLRVLISTDNYKNTTFDKLSLSAKNGLNILVKGQNKKMQTLEINTSNDFGIGENEIIIVEPTNKNDKISIKNLKRGYINPEFYGKIEICKTNGKYILINEVNLEDYIASFLASSNYNIKEKEALKALSIVYRTKTINEINKNTLANLGANLSDLSYNNLPTEKIFIDATNETKGKILKSEGEIISPSYFNYSSGATANSGEVWPETKSFSYPAEDKPYLKHTKDFKNTPYDNLSDEINANIFYKTKDIDSPEKDSKWFRWTTTLEEKDINKINENIKNLYKTEKFFLKTLKNGSYIYLPVEDIGRIKDITIKERGEGGNVMSLEIVGEKETVLALNDNITKKIFSISSIVDNYNQIVQDIKYLPSNYYIFDKTYDNNGYLKKITFYGGGFGHGVGLSINGADSMAKNKANFKEILEKYYTNIEISDISTKEGE